VSDLTDELGPTKPTPSMCSALMVRPATAATFVDLNQDCLPQNRRKLISWTLKAVDSAYGPPNLSKRGSAH
jgi:hypothetical protein